MSIDLIETTYAIAINVKTLSKTELKIGVLIVLPRCPKTIQLNEFVIATPEDAINQQVAEIYTEDVYKITRYV